MRGVREREHVHTRYRSSKEQKNPVLHTERTNQDTTENPQPPLQGARSLAKPVEEGERRKTSSSPWRTHFVSPPQRDTAKPSRTTVENTCRTTLRAVSVTDA